jgi:hypothetical protein
MAMGMKHRKPPKRGYQDRLTAALSSLDLPAGVGRVSVFHDKRRGVFRGRVCNCTPDISIHTGDGDVAVVDLGGALNRVKQS